MKKKSPKKLTLHKLTIMVLPFHWDAAKGGDGLSGSMCPNSGLTCVQSLKYPCETEYGYELHQCNPCNDDVSAFPCTFAGGC